MARGYGQSLGRKQRVPSKHLELEEGVRRMRLRIQRQEALLQVLRPAEPLGAAVQAVHTLPECDNWRTRSANHMGSHAFTPKSSIP